MSDFFKKYQSLILVIVSISIGFIIAYYNQNHKINIFSINNALIVAIVVIAVLVLVFSMFAGLKSKSDAKHALGLPVGSVRAIIALAVTVLFILTAVYFYQTVGGKEKLKLAENILTILGTLVVAVSAFYFSAKATQQGVDVATKVFANSNQFFGKTPVEAIQDAINKNKADWKKKYNCEDVKLGKKESDGDKFDMNCIVFIVAKKAEQSDTSVQIPKFISHTYQEKTYQIPTDIREKKEEKPVTLDVIENLIETHEDEWLKKFNADSVMAALKLEKGQTKKIPCLQFSVVNKQDQSQTQHEDIPDFIHVDGYKVPTDVLEEDMPTQDSSSIQLGDGIYREGTNSIGTLGLKVYKTDDDGNQTDYLLSCYHVFCSVELNNNQTTTFDPSSGQKGIFSERGDIKLGEVTQGYLDNYMDAALCKIDSNINLSPKIKSFTRSPKRGIRIISTDDVMNEISVFSHSYTENRKVTGKIVARKTNKWVTINGYDYYFKDVIPVTKISNHGDSGSAVLDSYGKVIGIVFASNDLKSYIIPISEILINFNLKIHHV